MSRRPIPFRATFAAVALTTICAAAPAGAAVLATSSLDTGGTDELVCRIVNLGPKPIDVHAALIDSNTGRAIVDSDLEIEPGRADLVAGDGRLTGHCLFTGTFRKGDVRASLDVFSQDRTILVVPAN